jgi:hypothetical protein
LLAWGHGEPNKSCCRLPENKRQKKKKIYTQPKQKPTCHFKLYIAEASKDFFYFNSLPSI